MKTPMTLVKSSGADPPAAMKVAPATSGLISSYPKVNSLVFSFLFGTSQPGSGTAQEKLNEGPMKTW